MLVVEPSNDFLPSWVDEPQRSMMVPVSDYNTRNVGVFSLFGDTSTKFSDRCPNAIVQTSSIPKSDVQVLWTAPPKGSGCVVFRCVLSCDETVCCTCVWSECFSDGHHNRFCDWVACWATRAESFSVPKSTLEHTPAAIQSLLGVKQPGHES
jgi:hypothetical protein